MCSAWDRIGRAFEIHVQKAGESGFADLAAQRPSLRPYRDGVALIAHLRERVGSDPERDGILGELAVAANARDDTSHLAAALLWRAFWPGLSGLFAQSVAGSFEEADELAADLAATFTAVVSRFDPQKVTRVAATLLWNTEREHWCNLRQRCAVRDRESPFDAAAEVRAMVSPLADAVDALDDLDRVLGDDAQLVLACLVEGLTTGEAAERYGISRDALRKRLQRAATVLRASESDLSAENDVLDRPRNPLTPDRGTKMSVGRNHRGGRLSLLRGCSRRTGTTNWRQAPPVRDQHGSQPHPDVPPPSVTVVVRGDRPASGHGADDTRVSYCDVCRRWGETGTLHVCGNNWSEHLGPVLATLSRRFS